MIEHVRVDDAPAALDALDGEDADRAPLGEGVAYGLVADGPFGMPPSRTVSGRSSISRTLRGARLEPVPNDRLTLVST